MSTAIDFYFDFSSPYGYFASAKIDELAAKYGRTVAWRPILLGIVFKTTGARPLPELPLKGDYVRKDFERSARFHGIPYRTPAAFPVGTMSATRAYWWLQATDPAKAVDLAKGLYKAYFVDGANISDTGEVIKAAQGIGLGADEVAAGINDPAVKEKVKMEIESAIARNVFGSPYVIVDNEPFWGMDRFDQLERWLQKPF